MAWKVLDPKAGAGTGAPSPAAQPKSPDPPQPARAPTTGGARRAAFWFAPVVCFPDKRSGT